MQIHNKTYPNGLRSLSVLTPDTESVTVLFLVNVGSRYELPAEAGLAHFVEHTIFKGTEKRPSSKQIGMEIESLGGSSNAFTSYDYTGYYIKAPAVNFAGTFEILADMFLNSTFAENEIQKERGVIIEEIRMYEDRPTAKVSQVWTANYFQDNTLALDITGTIDSVSNMQRQQFLDFLHKHYYAENVLVVVAGNVEQTQVEEAINQYCLTIPSREQSGVEVSSYGDFQFAQTDSRVRDLRLQKEVEQAHVIIGGKALNRDDDRRYAFRVANAILGSGFGSKLFQVIRDELGLAYYVYSKLNAFSDIGVFNVGMGVHMDRIDEALAAAKDQMKAVAEGDYTQAEFERAKNYLLGNLVTELETSEDIASFEGMQELLNKERFTVEEIKEKILGITRDEVHAVVQDIFVEDNYFQAVLSR